MISPALRDGRPATTKTGCERVGRRIVRLSTLGGAVREDVAIVSG